MRNLILILLLATTNLFAQKWEFKKNKDYQDYLIFFLRSED